MKKIFILMGVAALLMSCDNNNDIDGDVDNNNKETVKFITKPDNEVTFTYKGEIYFTKYSIIEDSIFVYENEKVGLLLEELDLRESSVYVKEDGTLEYYDSLEELQEIKGIQHCAKTVNESNNDASLRTWPSVVIPTKITECWYNVGSILPNGTEWSVQFFRDPNFKGENIAFKKDGSYNLGDLRNFKLQYSKKSWNDQPCSLILTRGAFLTLFRDDFKGATISFHHTSSSYGFFKVPDLGNFRCSKHRSWRDQATTFELGDSYNF